MRLCIKPEGSCRMDWLKCVHRIKKKHDKEIKLYGKEKDLPFFFFFTTVLSKCKQRHLFPNEHYAQRRRRIEWSKSSVDKR